MYLLSLFLLFLSLKLFVIIKTDGIIKNFETKKNRSTKSIISRLIFIDL